MDLVVKTDLSTLFRHFCFGSSRLLMIFLALTVLAPAFALEEKAVTESHQPRVGVVLGGGGARGAAHVGVLKVLEQEGVNIDCLVGTNVGAVVGGLYCAGVSVGDVYKKILDARLPAMEAIGTIKNLIEKASH
jgi:hypothetical protein